MSSREQGIVVAEDGEALPEEEGTAIERQRPDVATAVELYLKLARGEPRRALAVAVSNAIDASRLVSRGFARLGADRPARRGGARDTCRIPVGHRPALLRHMRPKGRLPPRPAWGPLWAGAIPSKVLAGLSADCPARDRRAPIKPRGGRMDAQLDLLPLDPFSRCPA